jgi:hypothetical protein
VLSLRLSANRSARCAYPGSFASRRPTSYLWTGLMTNVGRLLAASGTSDVVDAHVVICARRAGQQAVTCDPDDLRALDPTLGVVTV